MSIKFLLVSSVIGLIIVMPIQNQYDPDGGWDNVTSITRVIDTEKKKKPDVDPDMSYLWAYLVFTYVFTGLLSFFLVSQSRMVSKLRQEYLGSQSSVADRTIKLSGIPTELRDEDKLREHIEKLRIGDVSAVTICRDWTEIDKLSEQRAAILKKLEEAYVAWEGRRPERNLQTLPIVRPTSHEGERPGSSSSRDSHPLINGNRKPIRQRPKIRTGLWGLVGTEVDAIDFYMAKLQRLDETIFMARKKEYHATPMAFVTFDKVSGAV
jgi:calcium permeable stress-gated cation channel